MYLPVDDITFSRQDWREKIFFLILLESCGVLGERYYVLVKIGALFISKKKITPSDNQLVAALAN